MEINKVFFKHYRYVQGTNNIKRYFRGRSEWEPSTKGGHTICIIVGENNKEYAGFSVCSDKDTFNYKVGREIAFGRALKFMSVCKQAYKES